MIDELGPLELVRDVGWTAAVPVLKADEYRLAVVVVRPKLVSTLQEQLVTGMRRTLRLTGSNRDAMEREVMSRLEVDA